MILKLLKFKV